MPFSLFPPPRSSTNLETVLDFPTRLFTLCKYYLCTLGHFMLVSFFVNIHSLFSLPMDQCIGHLRHYYKLRYAYVIQHYKLRYHILKNDCFLRKKDGTRSDSFSSLVPPVDGTPMKLNGGHITIMIIMLSDRVLFLCRFSTPIFVI